MEATYVVIGGGIAGVTCAETLAFLEISEPIILVSESSLIKTVTNLRAVTRTLTNFDIEEQDTTFLSNKYSNITVLHDSLTKIDDVSQTVHTCKFTIKYKYLCLCMGATPKILLKNDPKVLGIRDTDSVELFVQKLSQSKNVIIVGNGGIASELVFKLKNVQVDWIIKDKHIASTFIDPGAAEFFQSSLKNDSKIECKTEVCKRIKYKEGDFKSGAALGPDWYQNLIIEGKNTNKTKLEIYYDSEIANVIHINDALEVELINGKKIVTDLIVSATGVLPCSNFKSINKFDLSEDGGLKINEFMQTSLPNIYAAGDICTSNWNEAKHWFQMKLWTQARQMGSYAAKSMSGHFHNMQVLQDFCFEMFSHTTNLFGYKAILLGLYNGQKLDRDYEILLRVTRDKEYVKFIMQNNRLQGAILIGDTDLEETCENLILNQLDLSPYGDDILNPNIDIEDYFD